jgi:predicted XRE-type DNA-binding protein
MNKCKPIVVRNANEFWLSAPDAVELEIRSQINDKIIDAMKRSGLTHAQVAKAAQTSRPRLTPC